MHRTKPDYVGRKVSHQDGRLAYRSIHTEGHRSNGSGVAGSGNTDTHLIYEGLSRVAADAVLAGARTVHTDAFFSVWHLYLTTTSQDAGEPGTPWYTGAISPAREVISRKRWCDAGVAVEFEHIVIRSRRSQ